MERALIVGLAVAVVALGTTAAVLRPAVVRLGGPQPPALPPGVVVESWSGSRPGIWDSPAGGGRRRRDVSRFPGRGPGGAK